MKGKSLDAALRRNPAAGAVMLCGGAMELAAVFMDLGLALTMALFLTGLCAVWLSTMLVAWEMRNEPNGR